MGVHPVAHPVPGFIAPRWAPRLLKCCGSYTMSHCGVGHALLLNDELEALLHDIHIICIDDVSEEINMKVVAKRK